RAISLRERFWATSKALTCRELCLTLRSALPLRRAVEVIRWRARSLPCEATACLRDIAKHFRAALPCVSQDLSLPGCSPSQGHSGSTDIDRGRASDGPCRFSDRVIRAW